VRQLGWEVEGVEIASNATAVTDFPVFRCKLPDIPINCERYDAVTAWAVLEHVHDPMAYFEKVGTILNSGGIFIFLVTNFESASSRYLFREDVPRHLYFFSRPTVAKYLASCGLSFERAISANNIYCMRPVNWLRLFLRRLAQMRSLTWKELPESRQDYLRRIQRAPTVLWNAAYAVAHPFTTIDRILLPLYEQFQLAVGSYGITTYIARKKVEKTC
jgi:cyclopropane fatty-acyl-phospholipid synthase-like methyltransferase